VADSWEATGGEQTHYLEVDSYAFGLNAFTFSTCLGHFERRISFGYDADLSQVRAEFDGELLRVIVPRRMPSITWYGEARE